jgi:ParB/RepB/Spo0J family partition protein
MARIRKESVQTAEQDPDQMEPATAATAVLDGPDDDPDAGAEPVPGSDGEEEGDEPPQEEAAQGKQIDPVLLREAVESDNFPVGLTVTCGDCMNPAEIMEIGEANADGVMPVKLSCGCEPDYDLMVENQYNFLGGDDDDEDDAEEYGNHEGSNKDTAPRITEVSGTALTTEHAQSVDIISQLTAAMKPQVISMDRIKAGNNVRTNYDKQKLNELTLSVRTHGVLQSPLSRYEDPENPNTSMVVIVDGHRRFLAASQGKLKEMPMFVHPTMTEAEAREIMLVANMQREDLGAVDEARVYREMLDANPNVTIEEVAARAGKPARYVSQRLRWLQVPESIVSYIDQQLLEARVGLLFARIGNPELRQRASIQFKNQFSFTGAGYNYPTYANVERWINNNYMLVLAAAPFDIHDTTLNPKQGACDGCPFRTGNATDLFGTGDRADVCMNKVCYELKCDTQFARIVKQSETDPNIEVLSKEDAEKLYNQWGGWNDNCRYVKQDGNQYLKGPGDKTFQKYQLVDMVKGHELKAYYAKGKSGEVLTMWDKEQFRAAAEANGFQFERDSGGSGSMGRMKKTDKEKEAERKKKVSDYVGVLAKVSAARIMAKSLKAGLGIVWDDLKFWEYLRDKIGRDSMASQNLASALELGKFKTSHESDQLLKKYSAESAEHARDVFFGTMMLRYNGYGKDDEVQRVIKLLNVNNEHCKAKAEERYPKPKAKADKPASKKPKSDAPQELVIGSRVHARTKPERFGSIVSIDKGRVKCQVLWEDEKKQATAILAALVLAPTAVVAPAEQAAAKKPAASKQSDSKAKPAAKPKAAAKKKK